jgi:hypothetical protein
VFHRVGKKSFTYGAATEGLQYRWISVFASVWSASLHQHLETSGLFRGHSRRVPRVCCVCVCAGMLPPPMPYMPRPPGGQGPPRGNTLA